ncbi:DEAD/DEAH box helicase [Demequina sp. B12]|uniref:DEAD/DEAH box helicase n=1 Tax=Demequina sp. B12 TaxID=2992757 RepID=UPI00237AE4C8|nr:DEAD/DEAH box helicase [Demequina sp. B12]MDE0573348.1 DEAD/DEAH box helicase [Demequina sp. B12]
MTKAGLSAPFPIQAATIADALEGRDVLGKARTGSGKTLGFGLPAITRLADLPRPRAHYPHAIVLVPTRELAMQVNDALEPFAHAMDVSLKLVAGGLSMTKQIAALERGVHLVVATPGRLADLVRRGHADMSRVTLVVLDEADHMAEMGFMDEIEEILADVPTDGQRLLFSATLDGDVDRLVQGYMDDPVLHDVTDGDDAPSTMRHVALNVPPHLKYQFAHRIAARKGRTIVFVRTKLACDRIAAEMRAAGVTAVALHGDKTQVERNNAITGFRAGRVPVLVATDVAARGIHVDHVDLVLQLDPPADFKDYTHRAGRTARAGREGLVVTLVLPHQRKAMDRIVDNADVDMTFRKLRDESDETLRTLTELTGAQEPTGSPVKEPRAPRDDRESRRPSGHGSRRPATRTPRQRRDDDDGTRGSRKTRPTRQSAGSSDVRPEDKRRRPRTSEDQRRPDNRVKRASVERSRDAGARPSGQRSQSRRDDRVRDRMPERSSRKGSDDVWVESPERKRPSSGTPDPSHKKRHKKKDSGSAKKKQRAKTTSSRRGKPRPKKKL